MRWIVAAFVVACSSKSPPPSPAPVGSGSSAGSAVATDPCVAIRARFAAALATRTDTCTTAADCVCYNPVGGSDEGCGGVTDAGTGAKLAALQKEFDTAACHYTHNCAAWSCVPVCTAGRCAH